MTDVREGFTRRSLLGGAAAMSLVALFRTKRDPSVLIEPVSDEQILEECELNPSAIDLVVVPQRAFRPYRLVIPTAITPLWTIENIVISNEPRFARDSIPGDFFAFDQPDMDMSLPGVRDGAEIRMRIRRSGFRPIGAPERFYGAFIGDSIDATPAPDGHYPRSGAMVLPISSDPFLIIP